MLDSFVSVTVVGHTVQGLYTSKASQSAGVECTLILNGI